MERIRHNPLTPEFRTRVRKTIRHGFQALRSADYRDIPVTPGEIVAPLIVIATGATVAALSRFTESPALAEIRVDIGSLISGVGSLGLVNQLRRL